MHCRQGATAAGFTVRSAAGKCHVRRAGFLCAGTYFKELNEISNARCSVKEWRAFYILLIGFRQELFLFEVQEEKNLTFV